MKAVRSTTKLSLICSLALIVLNSTFGFITQGRTFCSSQLGAVRDATSSTKSGSLTRRTPVRYAISNRITDEEMQAEKDGGGRVPNKRQLSSQLRAKVKELYKQAEAAAARGQAGSARALLTEGVGLDPRDGHSWLALARLEQGLGRHATARQVFAEGVEQCPANVHLWQAWAVMEARLNQVARARELFAAAHALDPGNPYVCHAWGLLEGKEGDAPRARALYRAALDRRSWAQVVVALGELEAAGGDLAAAREAFEWGLRSLRGPGGGPPLPANRVELLLGWARVEEGPGADPRRAGELLAQAQGVDPTSAKVALARAEFEDRRGSAITARALFEKTPEMRHTDGQMYNAWARFEAKYGRPSRAIAILEDARRREPRDHTLPQAQGKLEENAGNAARAMELYQQSIRLRPNAAAFAAWALLEARQKAGQRAPGGAGERTYEAHGLPLARARALFEQGLEADPGHGPLYNAYAGVEAAAGHAERAAAVLRRGLAAAVEDRGSVWAGLARLELARDAPEAAAGYLRRGLADAAVRGEGAAVLWHSLGTLELGRHRLAEALEALGRGVQAHPTSSQLLLAVASCYVQLGGHAEARAFFGRAVRADARHAQAYQAWGVFEARLGDAQAAENLYEAGLRACPGHGALWQAYGLLARKAGDAAKARRLWEEGLRRCPGDVMLHQALACLEVKEKNPQAARRLMKEAILRDPGHGACWSVFALAEEKAGTPEKAREVYRQGLRYAPGHGPLYGAYAKFEMRQRNFLRARAIFEEGLQADPYCASIYHAYAELEASLGNIDGLNALNKKAKELFDVNIPERTKEEYLKRTKQLQQSFFIEDEDAGNQEEDDEEAGPLDGIEKDDVLEKVLEEEEDNKFY